MIEKEKNFISAVIYVHHNERELSGFLQMLLEELEQHFLKYEIICVDDYSTGECQEILEELKKTYEKTVFSVIRLGIYHGMEASMRAGVDLAIGDYVFEFDHLEMDYEPDLIYQLYQCCTNGKDIVSAVPKNRKRASSRLFYNIFNKNFSSSNKIATESFRVLSRRAMNRIGNMSSVVSYRKALYANSGLAVEQMLYDNKMMNRKMSTETRRYRREMAMTTLVLYTDSAYRLTLTFAFLMIALVILIAGYTVTVFLTGRPVEGWTTMMMFLSLGFLGIFSILAVMIKYLSLILEFVLKKQSYMIESIKKM